MIWNVLRTKVIFSRRRETAAHSKSCMLVIKRARKWNMWVKRITKVVDLRTYNTYKSKKIGMTIDRSRSQKNERTNEQTRYTYKYLTKYNILLYITAGLTTAYPTIKSNY